MNDIRDRIIALVQSRGPVLPVEISSAINANSFLAKAYLSDLVAEGKIRATKEKIGDSHIYFWPGQEQKVSEKLQSLRQLQAKTARMYQPAEQRVQATPELMKKRQEFSSMANKVAEEDKVLARKEIQKPAPRMEQFRPQPRQEQRFEQRHQPVLPAAKPIIFKRLEPEVVREPPRIIEITPEVREPMPRALKAFASAPKNFVDKARYFIEAENGKITEVIERKKKFAEFHALIHTTFGEVKFIIHARDKNKITDSDLSLLYSKSSQRNIPGLLITNGQLNKKAQRFLETVKDSVKVKVI